MSAATSPTPPRSTRPSPRPRRCSAARSRCSSPTPASPRTRLLMRMTDEEFDTVLDTNLTGAFRCARARGQRMIRSAGAASCYLAASSGSTAARAGQLRREQGRPGRPGPLDHPRARRPQHHRQRRRPRLHRHRHDGRAPRGAAEGLHPPAIPAGRFATPEEVAARRRASSRATPPAYITGAVIPVDGGLGMGH